MPAASGDKTHKWQHTFRCIYRGDLNLDAFAFPLFSEPSDSFAFLLISEIIKTRFLVSAGRHVKRVVVERSEIALERRRYRDPLVIWKNVFRYVKKNIFFFVGNINLFLEISGDFSFAASESSKKKKFHRDFSFPLYATAVLPRVFV